MDASNNQSPVTEDEIDAAEKLRVTGDFSKVLALTQGMLERVEDGDLRMRLLFDVIACSTQLGADDITEEAMGELGKLPFPEYAHVLANSIRANAEIDQGRPQNALAIVDMIFETGYFERDDFRIHQYQILFFKGKALERLSRWEEALEWLQKAHAMYPDERSAAEGDAQQVFFWVETEILFNKVRSMCGLKRFDEAFELSKQAYERESGDMKTVAAMYMANCRSNQGRFREALGLYVEVQRELPCRGIDVNSLQDSIRRCMAHLETSASSNMPS